MKHPMRSWVATPVGEGEGAGGELIWVSSHNALAEAGRVEGQDFSAQFAQSMQRLERTLHEAGTSWGDIVSARVYVPQPEHLEGLESRLSQFLREPGPALTILCSPLRPGLLFEIECVAVRPRPNLHVGG